MSPYVSKCLRTVSLPPGLISGPPPLAQPLFPTLFLAISLETDFFLPSIVSHPDSATGSLSRWYIRLKMASNYNLVGQHERYADSDGLQVVETPPGGDLMVVNEQEGYKEASPVPTPTATPATMKTYHDTTALHAESQSEPRRPWWKRKLFIGLAIAFVVLALGLGIGLGVALSSNSSDDEEGSNNDESNQDS